MSERVIGLTIDNGGSGLRVLPTARVSSNIEDTIIEFENMFYKIPDDTFCQKKVDDPAAMICVIDAPDKSYKGYYAAGRVGRSYTGTLLPLDPGNHKSESKNFYLQLIYDIAQGVIRDESLKDVLADEDDLTELIPKNWTVAVGTSIPMQEHSSDNDLISVLKESVAGKYTISYPLLSGCPVLNINIDENFFGVLPEGGVVITSFGDAIKDDDITLIFDMGHISTDLAVYMGKELEGKSVESSDIAGTTLISILRQKLELGGYRTNETMCCDAIATGMLKQPGGYVNVKKFVSAANEDFMKNYMHKEIVRVLQRAQIIPEQLDNIIPIGMPMNNIDDVAYIPDIFVEDFKIEGLRVLKTDCNARYANILAVEKFTKVLLAMAKKALTSNI